MEFWVAETDKFARKTRKGVKNKTTTARTYRVLWGG